MLDRRPSLLVISHTYVVAEHRKKLEALAKSFDLTCVTMRAQELGPLYGLDGRHFTGGQPLSYRLIELPIIGKLGTWFLMSGLWPAVRDQAFDLILVENEPWLAVKWQSLIAQRLWNRQARYGEFTWENVTRPGLKGLIHRIAYKLTAKCADFWIAGNKAAADIVCAAGMKEERVLVCPQLGVDETLYAPCSPESKTSQRAGLGIEGDAFVVGFAGRMIAEKGINELVEAVAALATEDSRLRLVLVGDGPLKPLLRERAKSCPWLCLPDPVPHQQLPALLQTMDLLVLGSHPVRSANECWEEQFGHILIEAIGCDCVVAGSDSGAIPEVIGDDEMIFPVGDQASIGALIQRAMKSPDWLQSKRQLQRSRLFANYTHERVATKLTSFLHGL